MQIPAETLWPLILTSAGVAAIVSAGATLIGQALERKTRRKELLLGKAIDLARTRAERLMRIADSRGARTTLEDDIVTAETYYSWLQSLWETGRLPDDPRIERLTADELESSVEAGREGEPEDL